MKDKILYHGSVNLIQQPVYGFGRPYNDYGLGFYCTQNIELAKEWSCVDNQTNGYVNEYKINTNKLKILNLTSKKYSILNWMAVLVKHRAFDIDSSIATRAKQFLLDNYYINVAEYDVIEGYRADDSYFKFAKDFLNNTISIQKLQQAMELGKLGKQVVLISQKAFDEIKFVNSYKVDNLIYYTKRISRDNKAREDYHAVKNDIIDNETYIIDIIRSGGV